MRIEKMTNAHAKDVLEIYAAGISTGNATFESTVPHWETWDESHLQKPRIVAVNDYDELMGWAALSPVSGRCVYGGVAEVSVYVSPQAQGLGIGKQLLTHLIKASEAEQLWTLQAGIFPENLASISLHEAVGFRLVGRREKIGKMNGVWRDTLLFERRSKITGQ